jgi:pyruvate/2-oxoglutarate dehydrogenase complex dihydrolipoamide acyltransferase (E2) component
MEVEAPATGRLYHIIVQPGDKIAVGSVMAWLYPEGAILGPAPAVALSAPPQPEPPPAPVPAPAIWLYHVEGATQNDIATIRTIAPTALITDEQTALALLS